MAETQIRILVVDDEKPIRRFLNAALGGQYNILEAATGEEALAAVVAGRPDIVLLDLGLPDIDGVEVTRRLREWTHIPIIIVSVREQEEQKIAALDVGADDYLTKPFGAGELNARIRAALRRSMLPEAEPIFQTEGLLVDLARRDVVNRGEHVSLTPTEYDILRLLVQHVGKVLTHDQIIRSVWGPDRDEEDDDSHLLRVNVSNLRRKIEADPSRPHYIVTEPGVGYRLRAA